MPYNRRRGYRKRRGYVTRVRRTSHSNSSSIPVQSSHTETENRSSTTSQLSSNPQTEVQTDSFSTLSRLSDIGSISLSSRSDFQLDVTSIFFGSSHSSTLSDTEPASSNVSAPDLNEGKDSKEQLDENASYFDMSIPIFDIARSNSSLDNNDLPFNIRFPDYLEMDFIRFPPAEVEKKREDAAPPISSMTPWRVRFEQGLLDKNTFTEDTDDIVDDESPGLLDKLENEDQKYSTSMKNLVSKDAHAVLSSPADINVSPSLPDICQEIQHPELASLLYNNECYHHMKATHSQQGILQPNLFFEPNFNSWLNPPPEVTEESNNENTPIAAIRAYAELYFSSIGLFDFNLKPVWTEPRLQIFEIIPTSTGPISISPILPGAPVANEEGTEGLTYPLRRSPACMNLAAMIPEEERTEELPNVASSNDEESDGGIQILFSKLSLSSDSESLTSNGTKPGTSTGSLDDDNFQADDEASSKTSTEDLDKKKSENKSSVEKQQGDP